MTSAQRIEETLDHREPDRIPFDLGSTTATGITRTAYERLLSYLGEKRKEISILDIVQQLADPDESFLERFKVDTRGLTSRIFQTTKVEEDVQYKYFTDEWGVRWRMPKDKGLYFDMCGHPLAGALSIDDIRKYTWPDPADAVMIKGLEEKAQRLGQKVKPVFVLRGAGVCSFEMAWVLRGMKNFLEDLALNPSLACYLMDRILEFNMRNVEFLLDKLGQYASIIYISDDIADQRGTIMSPQMYRKYIKPRHKKLFSFIKKTCPGSIYIFYHCCGNVHEIIPDLIEVGVDILNPVQVSAANMDTYRLKKEFGQELTFWGGGVDTQRILPHGTPNQVREEVKRRINDLAPGGGFVFCPVHNVQPDVPPENFLAMWETLQEFGVY